MKKILVTGGCGYVGSRLVPFLMAKGYDVRVLDSLIFGNNIKNFNFELIAGDIRNKNILKKATKGIDSVIHLAAISNDPTAELNERITKEVNYDAIVELLNISKKNGINRFILASSSTLYGFSGGAKLLKESDEKDPLTIYGKYKLLSEEKAFELADEDFIVTAARPGTVAGFSPRQRFDLIVNIFTNHALTRKKLMIEGGKQKRPIINIADLCLAYEKLLISNDKKVNREAFNIVGENLTVEQIAKKVAKLIPGTKIEYIEKFDDKRSYFTSGQKIYNLLNFKPKFSIEEAILEIEQKFNEGFFYDTLNNIEYYNIKKIKSVGEIS